MRIKIRIISLLISALFLLSCAAQQDQRPVPGAFPVHNKTVEGTIVGAAGGAAYGGVTKMGVPAGAVVGSIAGGLIGHNEQTRVLKERGVSVVQVGDETTIILPTDQFFEPALPTLLPDTYAALNSLALMLKDYGYAPIRITGYTDNFGSPTHQLTLSKARAQTIASYLWAHGIPADRLVVAGAGNADPIATSLTLRGRAQNRRVEIIARRIPSHV